MEKRNPSRRARAGAAKRGGSPKAKSHERSARPVPDLHEILGRFSDVLSVLAVVQRSLALQEYSGIGDEELTLRRAIDELKSVYNELDTATLRLQPVPPSEASDLDSDEPG